MCFKILTHNIFFSVKLAEGHNQVKLLQIQLKKIVSVIKEEIYTWILLITLNSAIAGLRNN